MPFDPGLAERLTALVEERFSQVVGLEAKKMLGGFGYLLKGNMCFGIHKETLMIRVGVETAEKIIGQSGVREMDLTGKVMKGWATVEPEAMMEDDDLFLFCKYAIDFVNTLPAK